MGDFKDLEKKLAKKAAKVESKFIRFKTEALSMLVDAKSYLFDHALGLVIFFALVFAIIATLNVLTTTG